MIVLIFCKPKFHKKNGAGLSTCDIDRVFYTVTVEINT